MKTAITTFFACVLFAITHNAIAIDHSSDKIIAIEDVTRGAQVNIQGQVTRILDEDEFRLQDDTGSIRIYIGWKNRVPVNIGETVKVSGFVDDDLVNTFRPEIYASQLVREDGKIIKLR